MDRLTTIKKAIPVIQAWLDRNTRIKWRVTSWMRNSPSHKDGGAVDFAPVHFPGYPLVSGRSPLLNFALEPFRSLSSDKSLQDLRGKLPLLNITVFIEEDHLHVLIKVEPLVIIKRHLLLRDDCYQADFPKRRLVQERYFNGGPLPRREINLIMKGGRYAPRRPS